MTTEQRQHEWTPDGHDRIGNMIERCSRHGCTVRKIENCSTFWQKAKRGHWNDEETTPIPACEATP